MNKVYVTAFNEKGKTFSFTVRSSLGLQIIN